MNNEPKPEEIQDTEITPKEQQASTPQAAPESPQTREIERNQEKGEKIEAFERTVKSFKKIIVKSWIIRVVKAILLGLTFAFPLAGVLLMLARFEIISLDSSSIYAISAGVLFVVALVTVALLAQSQKAIAMRLDKEHKLDEKLQTMLAFRNEEGPMLDLQRQDANKAISKVKNTAIGIKQIWIYILCFLIGAGLCFVSFLFNPFPEPEPEPEPEIPYAVSELQLELLNNLIEDVKQSEMQEPYKENVIFALTTLSSEIKIATTVPQKETAVQKAMEEILIQTDNSSDALELMNTLWKTNAPTARLIAKMLNYYDWSKTNEWENYTEQVTNFREGFVHPNATDKDADELVIIEDTKNTLLITSTAILNSLTSAQMSNEDGLYIVLTRLASASELNEDGTRIFGMQPLSEFLMQNGYTKAQREIDATITALNGEIYKALTQNKVNTDTGENAIKTIASIFDMMAPEFERPEFYDSSSDSSTDGEGGGADGGIGGGPTYGSDDKVYDPFTNKYVEYGVILDKYYSIMFNKLQDGNYTDEEKKALEEYFKILYGGFEEKEENE